MDMAITLDNNLFREAEREAEQLDVSIPEFCSLAVKEFIKNRKKSELTKQINDFYSQFKTEIDADILQAQYDMLAEEEW